MIIAGTGLRKNYHRLTRLLVRGIKPATNLLNLRRDSASNENERCFEDYTTAAQFRFFNAMKRIGGLWEKICSDENIDKAFQIVYRGKRDKPAIKWVMAHEAELKKALQEMLRNGTYTFGVYFLFYVYEPKRRLVLVARTFPDRFMHAAVVNVTAPIFAARTHFHSYACIKGKGTHRAAKAVARLLSKYDWVVHIDIHAFYFSIRHSDMRSTYRRKIKDPQLLEWYDRYLDNLDPELMGTAQGVGIPIGDATSPWNGNILLWKLDEFITQVLHAEEVRYNDDMFIGANTEAEAKQYGVEIREFVAEEYSFTLSKMIIRNARQGVTGVGFKCFRDKSGKVVTILKKQNARKIKRFISDEATDEKLETIEEASKVHRTLTSINGILTHASTGRFRKSIDFDNTLEKFRMRGNEMIAEITDYYTGGKAHEKTVSVENVEGLKIYICGVETVKNKYYRETRTVDEKGMTIITNNGKNKEAAIFSFYIADFVAGKSEEEIRQSGKIYKTFSSAYSMTRAAEAFKDIDFESTLLEAMFTKNKNHPELTQYNAEYAKEKRINTALQFDILRKVDAAKMTI